MQAILALLLVLAGAAQAEELTADGIAAKTTVAFDKFEDETKIFTPSVAAQSSTPGITVEIGGAVRSGKRKKRELVGAVLLIQVTLPRKTEFTRALLIGGLEFKTEVARATPVCKSPTDCAFEENVLVMMNFMIDAFRNRDMEMSLRDHAGSRVDLTVPGALIEGFMRRVDEVIKGSAK